MVTTRLTMQYADPAARASDGFVHFEGTVSGLDPDSTVCAMVRRAGEREHWPVELADVEDGLRQGGPDADGIETSAPFRPAAPAPSAPSAPSATRTH
ncbi:hypothetical protein ABZZ20_07095 [Streptomyces sp. NPDC006430]|uniref:hypothetical protein n=1 Tax=Streptomyces sp. NPDC006430 TaxID=3154299 RepID=UPI0033A8AD39